METRWVVSSANILMYPDSKNARSFQEGLEFQDYVMETLNRWGMYVQCYTSKAYQYSRGESVQRVEIKLDNRCTETGRLSIEVAERTSLSRQWVPSGIFRNDNTVFYIQGNFELFFLFDRAFLRRWHEKKLKSRVTEKPTIKTFYISLEDATEYSIASFQRETTR